MISVEEARERLLAAAPRLPSEAVALADAAGRVLAAPVDAGRTQPPFAASAMDGYAVRSADLGGSLTLVGEAVAGRRFAGTLGPREAVRIFTGAPVPDGADAVLIQEDAEVSNGSLTAREAVEPGANIRPQGLDFAYGERLAAAGTRLAPRHLAVAGAGGHAKLQVARRPRVAFLATGDELVAPGEPAGEDQIVASVTPALSAMVRRAGAAAVDLGIIPDDEAAIARAAEAALKEADVLVTLGGASVGDHDLVRPALATLGIAPDFWRVAVRPGKPLMFSSRPLVLGLPGNPVSGVVCTLLFLVPLLEAMQGLADPGPHPLSARLGSDLPQNGPRRDHLRARLVDGVLHPFATQDSSMLALLSRADALLVRPPHDPPVRAGEHVRYYPL